ncbi:glycogen biosynthesis protein GlgD [Metabacillus litoralis]|nr:glycogen biosynthesis protein GlgD [Metabacillus litoralis]MCM3164570.1 glycogen biosynthesis protein GlgD [Metabacillus litoralis]MCM3410920.1 glycogen biosynthesis protein GlgD [Metabacillus litoralis]UHA62147.1 glycogen biosynthesis protein GlgD [Metabacillus litoralis]
MKKRSKQNNPEQKTKNGVNSNDLELGQDYDPIKETKAKNAKKGQPIKSKQRVEDEL